MRNLAVEPVTSRVGRHGDSLCVVLNREIRAAVPWQKGDVIAVRLCGEKLVLERVNLNAMARIRTGEVLPSNGTLFG